MSFIASMTTSSEPNLDAPGAGLPAIELFIGRILFGVRRRIGNRETFNAKFTAEREAIRALTDSCDPARRGERVLIPRRRGMEDSSRHWSVWMTLDHLRITNEAFARIITDLSQGRVPQGSASTATVKPSEFATASVVAEYERSCDAVLAAVANAREMKTAVRFSHPWFGPLDASGWHALAGGHMAIHRGQIESIVAGLAG